MRNVSIIVSLTLLGAILIFTVEPGHGFNCDKTKASVYPCVEYLTGHTPDPSFACCNAVSHLKASTPKRDDRIAACKCLKDAATHLPGIREDLAAALPKRCGVQIGFKISKDINCDTIPLAHESGR